MDGNKIIDNITLYQDYHGYYPASLDSLNLDNEMINCENFEYRLEGDSLYVISFELWPLYRFEYRPQEDEWLKLYLQQVMLNGTSDGVLLSETVHYADGTRAGVKTPDFC